MFGQEKGAGQVDGQHPVPVGQPEFFQRTGERPGNAGVVDQAVQPAEIPVDLRQQVGHRRLVAHVANERDDATVRLMRGLGRRLGVQVEDDHRAVLGGQVQGDAPADPLAAAGDQRQPCFFDIPVHGGVQVSERPTTSRTSSDSSGRAASRSSWARMSACRFAS